MGAVAIGELAAAVAVGCVSACLGSCGVSVTAFSSAAAVCVSVWTVDLLGGWKIMGWFKIA